MVWYMQQGSALKRDLLGWLCLLFCKIVVLRSIYNNELLSLLLQIWDDSAELPSNITPHVAVELTTITFRQQ